MKKTYIIIDDVNSAFTIELSVTTDDLIELEANEFVIEMKRVIAEWIKTPAGLAAMKETCGQFNWGDVMHYLQDLIAFSPWLISGIAWTHTHGLIHHDQSLLPENL